MEEEECFEASIVDIRPKERFLRRHLKGSVSFEFETLGTGGGQDTRATELPSRSWPVSLKVMGTTETETNLGLDWLETRGWKVNREESFIEEKIDWDSIKDQVEVGPSKCRFWRPSPPLEKKARLLENLLKKGEKWALDLGCGSGRDAVFLAMRGWNVVAVDREESFLEKVRAFAVREEVSHLVTTVCADLRPQYVATAISELFRSKNFDMIHMSRFMNRPLLAFLADFTPSDCFIVVHHFLIGAQSRHGKDFRQGAEQTLERFELRTRFFQGFKYEVLMEEDTTLADGRPVTSFICRRL